jgi:hypothetical protein
MGGVGAAKANGSGAHRIQIGTITAQVFDVLYEPSNGRCEPPRASLHDKLSVALLLAGHIRGEEQRSPAAGRFRDGPWPCFAHHDVRAVHPVGRAGDEPIHREPST